jgi:arginine/ornithine transport system substrate-binding protein
MPKRIMFAFIVLLAAATLALAAWQWRNTIVPLKIGIEGNYPPFTKTEADGSVTGFEIDLAKKLCSRLRARCELVKTEFDQLIPNLNAGQLDAVMASMTITEKRQLLVDFSDSYYNVPSAWIASAGTLASVMPGSMTKKTVAVLKGSPREAWVATNYPEMQVLAVPKETDVYTQITDKKADLALTSLLVAKTKFLNLPEGKGFVVVGEPVWLGNGVGVAVKKGDASLRSRFNRALSATVESGDYKQIQSAYFDFDLKERR